MNSQKNSESYYKILGTTAKIGQGRIKEKYIAAVKNHPPELDPEGFEKVRRAYETLKDPEKRKEYDLFRKYGSNIDDIIAKIYYALDDEDYAKVENLVQQASIIAPENWPIQAVLLKVAILKEKFDEMEVIFKQLLEKVTDEEEACTLYLMLAQMFLEQELYDDAFEVIKRGREEYPSHADVFMIPYVALCAVTGLTEEAWETMEGMIPLPENETIEDINYFIMLVNLMFDIEKKELMSKVKSRFRKFLKKLTKREEIEEAYELLMDELEEHFHNGNFQTAHFIIDVVKVIANLPNAEFSEKEKEIKKLAQLHKDFERLQSDDSIYPLVVFQAMEWFHQEWLPTDQIPNFLDEIPIELLEMFTENKEGHAAGIIRLSKKYPVIYRAYKDGWDELFEQLTFGLNREMKRELRKVR